MFGHFIRKARVKRSLKQEQCARDAGIDPSVYNRIENNKREPTVSELLSIARAMQAPPLELLGIGEPASEGGSSELPGSSSIHADTALLASMVQLAHAALQLATTSTNRAQRKARVAVKRSIMRGNPRGGG